MKKLEYKPQSYKWSAFTVLHPEDFTPGKDKGPFRLLMKVAGNLTEYTIEPSPEGQWWGVPIDYSGQVSESKTSTGELRLALASSGSWSGGSNYRGWIFGKVGATAYFNCKGSKQWLVFSEHGPQWHDTKPGEKPQEV